MCIYLCRYDLHTVSTGNRRDDKVTKAHLSWARNDHKLRGREQNYDSINVVKWVYEKGVPSGCKIRVMY